MKQLQKAVIEQYEDACNSLRDVFIEKYFGKKTETEFYWIADQIGGCLYINDRFFSVEDLVDFMKCNYTADEMFLYYDKRLESAEGGDDAYINIKSWKKLCKSKSQKK